MAIDPSISLAVRPPVIPAPNIMSPVDRLAQVLSLRNMMTQGESGQLDLQTKQLQYEQLQRDTENQRRLFEWLTQHQGGAAAAPETAPETTGAPPVQTGSIATPPPAPAAANYTPVAPYTPVGSAPAAPLGALMTSQTPAVTAPATAPAAPAAPPPASGGFPAVNLGEIVARFGNAGMAYAQKYIEAHKTELENQVKQADLIDKTATRLAGLGISVRDSKNPAGQFAVALTQAGKEGLLDWPLVRQMISDGYDKHKNDVQGFIDGAQKAKDQAEIHKSDMAALVDERKNVAYAMRGINSQQDYATKIVPMLSPALHDELGDTWSPQLNQVTRHWDVSSENLPKTTMSERAAVAQVLAPLLARNDGGASAKAYLATLSPDVAAPFLDVTTPQQAVQAAKEPDKLTPGVDVPFSPAVTAQRREEEAQKVRIQADPFGLFSGTTGAAAPGAAGAVTPSPLAQAIATFEGFDKAGSVAQRNNNPGNLRSGPGATGTDKNGYAIFPDLNTGWAALHDLIQKRSGDNLTLQEFFAGKKGVYPGYAPAADQNDPATYAATVAKQLNVDPTAKLADIPGSQVPAAAKPGARLTPDMQGQAVLDALPGPLAQQVKALAEGRLNLPTGRALTSGYWQQMLNLVGQYDPSFDVNNPGKRAATAKDFAAGKSAQQVNALNTVVGHLDSLSQAADKLDNTWSPAYNSVANWISANTGHPAVKNFETTKKAVVDELTRVWRGTGGSEGDIKSWSESLDAASSPEQLHNVIATIGHLLESKLSSLQDQYREGMGPISQGREMITPQARKTLDKLETKAGTGTPSKTATVDQVKAYAQKHNISEAEARKAAEAEGFVIR